MRACNQSTSRDPVVSYTTRTVEDTCAALKAAGLLRFVHMPSGRATTKYRQILDEHLGLENGEASLVGLLLLRGPQTVAELKTRSERWAHFDSVDSVVSTLQQLANRPVPLVVELPRFPGQKELRWMHLLAGPLDMDALVAASEPRAVSASPTSERVAALESTVVELRSEVDVLRATVVRLCEELGVAGPSDSAVGGPA
jgi:uncharacterized protein YceH (UPF0502 family)